MNTNQIQYLNKPPLMIFLYAKAVVNTLFKNITNFSSEESLSPLHYIHNQKVNLNNLQQYIACCGFKNTGYLPATYPFVIAFPLVMKLMTSSRFPVSTLGLIHYKNHIVQHDPIKQNANISIHCHMGKDKAVKIGRVIEIQINIYVEEKLAWECTSSFIERLKPKQPQSHLQKTNISRPSDHVSSQQTQDNVSSFKFSRLDALKYTYISKDINPIHLNSVFAKLMGFQASIVHGMFAKARVLAQLESLIDIQRISINVQFKNAIYLPSEVYLNASLSQQGSTFYVADAKKRVTHLSGVILPQLNRTN